VVRRIIRGAGLDIWRDASYILTHRAQSLRRNF
jgi:hypothetical protein